MAIINATTFASAIETIWKKEILPVAEGNMVLSNFAVSEGVPINGGNTIRVNRVLRPSKITTAKTLGAQVKLGDAGIQALTSNYRDFNLEIWESTFAIQEDTDIVSFITLPKNQKTIANQMARTHEYQLAKRISRECLNWRIDNDGTYQVFGSPLAGSTATAINTARNDADNFWDGANLCFYNPNAPGYDDASFVTDYQLGVANDGVFTLDRAINIPTTSSKYIASVKTGIVAGDVLTVSALSDVAFIHEHLETPKFGGGVFRGMISSAQHRDLRKDAAWQTFIQYDRSKTIENYLPGRWCDMEFLIGSEVYRSDVDGTENQATGLVHSALIFGADSFATFRYGSGVGNFNAEWLIVDKPDSYNLTNSAKFLSWKTKWTGGVLRATSAVALNTGTTAYGFNELV